MKATIENVTTTMLIISSTFALPMQHPGQHLNVDRAFSHVNAHHETGKHHVETEDWYPEDWHHIDDDPMQSSSLRPVNTVGHHHFTPLVDQPRIVTPSHSDTVSYSYLAKDPYSKSQTSPDSTPYGVSRPAPPRFKSRKLPSRRVRQDAHHADATYESLYNQLKSGIAGTPAMLKHVIGAIGKEKARRRNQKARSKGKGVNEDNELPDLRGSGHRVPSPEELQGFSIADKIKWENALRLAASYRGKAAVTKVPLVQNTTSPFHHTIWPAETKMKDLEPITTEDLKKMDVRSQEAWYNHRYAFPNENDEIGQAGTPKRESYMRSHKKLREKWGFDHFPEPARARGRKAKLYDGGTMDYESNHKQRRLQKDVP